MAVNIEKYTRHNIDCGSVVWMGDHEYEAMMSRIRELKRSSGVSREVTDVFEAQIRRLIEDNKKMKKYIRETERFADRERERIIRETEQRYLRMSGEIDRLEESVRQADRELDRVRKLVEHENGLRLQHRELAQKYYNEAVEEFNAICNEPYYVKFHADDLDRIRQQFSKMREDIADDTVSGLGIQILGDVEKMKIQVTREKARFEVEYLKALHAQDKLEAAIRTYRNELYFDEERKNKVDLDFWTGGRFGQLEQSAEYMRLHLERDRMAGDYLIPEIRSDIARIGELDRTMDSLVEETFRLSDMSEMVEWMGDVACQTLAQKFWYALVNRGFENDDPRGIYVVQARNYDNNTLLELFFSRQGNTISYTYRINLGFYMDGRLMKEFLRDFSAQIPEASLNLRDDMDHVDPELTFHPEQSRIEIPDPVKQRFGLA